MRGLEGNALQYACKDYELLFGAFLLNHHSVEAIIFIVCDTSKAVS